jgi:hypothetical protein
VREVAPKTVVPKTILGLTNLGLTNLDLTNLGLTNLGRTNLALMIATKVAKLRSSQTRLHSSRIRCRSVRWPAIVFLGCVFLLGIPSLGASDPATVTFTLDFPGSDPDHFFISVKSDGRAHYECSAKISPDSEDRENYQTEFNFSDATRARIFELAAQAHYFSGKIDSGNRKLANTGAKKLSYKDDQRDFTASYNFSPHPAVEQLTTLFQRVSATLEFGRRLAYYHRYQKLALDEQLKQMEDQARRGELAELQSVKPVLQQIYDDTSVLNVVRARAQRVMDMPPGLPPGR